MVLCMGIRHAAEESVMAQTYDVCEDTDLAGYQHSGYFGKA